MVLVKSEPAVQDEHPVDTAINLDSNMGNSTKTPRSAFVSEANKKRKTSKAQDVQSEPLPKVKKTKSRTGCITCKKRRLKCDETHPSCKNCTGKGIVCGGYTVAFKWKSFDQSEPTSKLPRKSSFSSISMNKSVSAPGPSRHGQRPEPPKESMLQMSLRKFSDSLNRIDASTLQKALEDATFSVTGKTYQEIAIANSLISSGKNPDLAPVIAEMLSNRGPAGLSSLTEQNSNNTGLVDQITAYNSEMSSTVSAKYDVKEELGEKKPEFSSLDALAAAVVEAEAQLEDDDEEAVVVDDDEPAIAPAIGPGDKILPVAESPQAISPGRVVQNDHSFGNIHFPINFPSPSANSPVMMSPNLQELLQDFENGDNSSGAKSRTAETSSLNVSTMPSPAFRPSAAASPRYSTLMKSFTNFYEVPSPIHLDLQEPVTRKRRFSDVSVFSSVSQKGSRRSNSDTHMTRPYFPGSLTTEGSSPFSEGSLAYSMKSPGFHLLQFSKMPPQVELHDDRYKMLAGFDKYTCGLMSVIGGLGNPWRTVLIPLAKQHSVLFNVFSAMTCFHVARGDESLRAQGVKYMNNTVVELAKGLSEGKMRPEIALITCLCLQNSETWDRQTSTGIAHLKGAKSMLLQILKNIRLGKRFLLDEGAVAEVAEVRTVDGSVPGSVDGSVDGSVQRSLPGSMAGSTNGSPDKVTTNLLFLFNSFVYFDVLARLTAESNDDIYGKVPRPSVSSSCSDREDDHEDDTGSVEELQDTQKDSSSSSGFTELLKSVSLEDSRIDPLLGCAQSLFPIIGKTADLVRQLEREKKNSLSIVSAAVQIKLDLEAWKPSELFKLPKGQDAELTACISTAEAYRYATLTLLHQAVPEIPSQSSHELSEIVLMLLLSIPNSSRTCITHIFPLLVASCEATPGEEREWVLQKWDLLIRKMWIGNIDRSLEVVKECWIRREIKQNQKKSQQKEGVHKLLSRIAGYVASARGEDQTEDDLSITGVKSWCHWRSVMKEWDWEVFLG